MADYASRMTSYPPQPGLIPPCRIKQEPQDYPIIPPCSGNPSGLSPYKGPGCRCEHPDLVEQIEGGGPGLFNLTVPYSTGEQTTTSEWEVKIEPIDHDRPSWGNSTLPTGENSTIARGENSTLHTADSSTLATVSVSNNPTFKKDPNLNEISANQESTPSKLFSFPTTPSKTSSPRKAYARNLGSDLSPRPSPFSSYVRAISMTPDTSSMTSSSSPARRKLIAGPREEPLELLSENLVQLKSQGFLARNTRGQVVFIPVMDKHGIIPDKHGLTIIPQTLDSLPGLSQRISPSTSNVDISMLGNNNIPAHSSTCKSSYTTPPSEKYNSGDGACLGGSEEFDFAAEPFVLMEDPFTLDTSMEGRGSDTLSVGGKPLDESFHTESTQDLLAHDAYLGGDLPGSVEDYAKWLSELGGMELPVDKGSQVIGTVQEKDNRDKDEAPKPEKIRKNKRRQTGSSTCSDSSGPSTKKSKHSHKNDQEIVDYTSHDWVNPAVPWQKRLKPIFKGSPNRPDLQRMYNKSMSEIAPHCSICQLFAKPGSQASGNSPAIKREAVPESSVPLVPEHVFARKAEFLDPDVVKVDETFGRDKDGKSRLLICATCCVCVHESCYGVDNLPDPGQEWYCRKCEEDSIYEGCCLCAMRGGALKLTTKGRWVHVVCALVMPESLFRNPTLKEPVNLVDSIPKRKILTCKYCYNKGGLTSKNHDACVQCVIGKCRTSFHVTCGFVADVTYEMTSKYFPVIVCCPNKHPELNQTVKKKKREYTKQLKIGDIVTCRYSNGLYYPNSVIIGIEKFVYYELLFEDGSYCRNFDSKNVLSMKCDDEDNKPEVDTKLRVLWPEDDQEYDAVYKGYNEEITCKVRFENFKKLDVKRENIYAEGEELPQGVKAKLSQATVSKLVNNAIISEREKKMNSRFFAD